MPGEEKHLMRMRGRDRFLAALAVAAVIALGYGAADSRRPDTASGAAGPENPLLAAETQSHTGGELYAAPLSPFLHGSSRGSFSPASPSDARRISFSNGITLDTGAGEPALPEGLRLDTYGSDRPGYYLVQLEGPVRAGWPDMLAAEGAELLAYLPDYTYLVRLDPRDLPALQNLSWVMWTGLYQPAYKLSAQPELAGTTGRQIVNMLLFPGEPTDAVEQVIVFGGGKVLERANGRNNLLRAEIDLASLAGLARSPEVAWIEPWHRYQLSNDQCQWVVQTFQSGVRKVWDRGITGTGQIISSSDTGVRTDHNAFRDSSIPITTFGDYPTHRKIISYQNPGNSPDVAFGDAAGASYHGTHTGGTLCGNDAPFGSQPYDGMAKDARLYFCDIGNASGGLVIALDLYSLVSLPYNGNPGGAARIMSNSWGADVSGAYTIDAMQVDQFMWDHPDFLLFFSNGNAGTAGSVGSPATAKDCVSAGGTGNGTSARSIYGSTSRGPTADGRRKPTVCAPATLTSSIGSSTTAYSSLSGTSMASPAMAGATLLARQYLTDGWYPSGTATPANGFVPSAALLKAMAVNSGQNDFTSYTVPDNNIGWGRVKLDQVLYFAGDTRRTVLVDNGDGLVTGDFVEYSFNVSDTSESLRISLVWTDYASTPTAARNLVNNLNLRATGGAVTYLGNVFSGGQSVTGGSPDSLNVEECVWRTTPAAGIWTVRVEGANVPFGPQPFALVVSGGLSSTAGTVFLDRSHYGGGDMMHIRVEDQNAAGSVTVALRSNTESTAEIVTLSPTILTAGGVFTGSFPTTLLGSAHGDGALSVSQGDQITATYTDTSPAGTSTATASVVLNPPLITNVGLLDVGSTSVVIGWTSSTASDSRVYYGTSPALGSASTLDPNLVLNHSHTVPGLSTGTTFYYDVESTDQYGNTIRDDNGGNHYRFTTRERGEVLLVIGDTTFPEVDRYRNALVRSGWLWDEWGTQQALNPPVGNRSSGLRAYRAIWWQVGWEQYPPFSDAARDSITRYNGGGGRLAVSSHDVAWAFGDASSGFWSAARQAWLADQLHATWLEDPSSWSATKGIAGDPISGSYLSNITYSAHRSGAAGDIVSSVAGAGTPNYVWLKATPLPAGNCAVRWVASAPSGSPDSALWGGTPTRVVSNFFEWARLNPSVEDDTTRAGILDKTLRWLVGRGHPAVRVTSPNGGQVFTGTTVNVFWLETPDGGTGVASRKIEYSEDSGESWNLITASPGTSPYAWNISTLPTSNLYRVRVTVVDNGDPSLTGVDASDADFRIARPGGDTRGPAVVAGSMTITPNPAVGPGNVVLRATLDDTYTGGSNIAAAEWNVGADPVPPGSGTAMSGAFSSPVTAVSDTVDVSTLPDGPNTLWIRGRDAAGAWGAAGSLAIQVNGGAPTVVGEAGSGAFRFALGQNVPNPFNPETTIRFGLERRGHASLAVYDVAGRLVRRLVDGELAPGAHDVRWDGHDLQGHAVASGVYFYRLEASGKSAVQKMVLMK